MPGRGTIGSITYSADANITTEPLHLTGGTIRVENASAVVINCETLIIDGDVLIDVRGVDGRPGIPGANNAKGDWMSGQGDRDSRHNQWEAAKADDVNHPDDWGGDAQPGTSGTNAGHLKIIYSHIGNSDALARIAKLVNGGAGGASAPGGLGRILVCGGHGERWRCRDGRGWYGGASGTPGSVDIIRRPSKKALSELSDTQVPTFEVYIPIER
jgi:hypothetical protein